MASKKPQTSSPISPPAPLQTRNTQLKSTLWNGLRIIIFLVVLSRAYALLITYNVVPDFPDPVLATLAQIYESFDQLVESGLGGVGNLVLGNVVFGALVRFYSSKSQKGRVGLKEGEGEKGKEVVVEEKKKKGEIKKKGAIREELPNEGKGSIDIRFGTAESNLKRNVVILGRLLQCAVFLRKSYGEGGNFAVRAVDVGVSVVIIALEVAGVKWDGGVVEGVSGWAGELLGGDEVVEEKKSEEVKLKLR